MMVHQKGQNLLIVLRIKSIKIHKGQRRSFTTSHEDYSRHAISYGALEKPLIIIETGPAFSSRFNAFRPSLCKA